MRPVLLCLFLLVLPSLAEAGAGKQYSGIKSMWFQNGLLPTSGYAGIRDTYIKDAVADQSKNYGVASVLHLSGPSFAGGGQEILFAADIDAIPDSSLIVGVRWWFYQASGSTAATTPQVTISRLFRDWIEGTKDGEAEAGSATWLNYGASTWAIAGGRGVIPNSTGGYVRWGSAYASNSDTSVVAPSYTGLDSLDKSITAYDIGALGTLWIPKNGPAFVYRTHGWISIELTHEAWLFHKTAWRNFGWITWTDPNGYDITGENTFYSSNYPDKLYRPKVEVLYMDPVTTSAVVRMGIGGIGR